MIIRSFSVENYKSYHRPFSLEFGRTTVITGRNDTGKTALLEALSLNFSNSPHRSAATLPSPEHGLTGDAATSSATVTFEAEITEVREFVSRLRGKTFSLPVASEIGDSTTATREAIGRLGNCTHVVATVRRSPNQRALVQSSLWPTASRPQAYGEVRVGWDGRWAPANVSGPADTRLELQLYDELATDRLFTLAAQRYSVGEAPHDAARVLVPNGVNLPTCLNDLATRERRRFERYLSYVKRVLPSVRDISIPPAGPQSVSIRVSYDDPSKERGDLAIPLSQCGTGVSQVLLMLYVLLESRYPRVILIDEPNTFLHPGAVRSLMGIFREFRQHQYIMSTHSPELIGLAAPEVILAVQKQGQESSVRALSGNDRSQMEFLLRELGASLSSVFGADRILWVEGAVEQACFPLILERVANVRPQGLAVLGVVSTGDLLSAKQRRMAHRIYQSLSDGAALVPPAVGFIFDKETLSDEDSKRLKEELGSKVNFLPYRMYENYLLDEAAITKVLGDSAEAAGVPRPSDDTVAEWYRSQVNNPKYYERDKVGSLADVNAARFLEDLFLAVSTGTIPYVKTKHSVLLTQELLDRVPEKLQGLAAFLAKVVGP